jgi:hypothetical protein
LNHVQTLLDHCGEGMLSPRTVHLLWPPAPMTVRLQLLAYHATRVTPGVYADLSHAVAVFTTIMAFLALTRLRPATHRPRRSH